ARRYFHRERALLPELAKHLRLRPASRAFSLVPPAKLELVIARLLADCLTVRDICVFLASRFIHGQSRPVNRRPRAGSCRGPPSGPGAGGLSLYWAKPPTSRQSLRSNNPSRSGAGARSAFAPAGDRSGFSRKTSLLRSRCRGPTRGSRRARDRHP